MAETTSLNTDVILRIANQIEVNDTGKEDTIRALGLSLELNKDIVDQALTLIGSKSSNLVDATRHLLNEWVNEHGSDDKAVKKLKTILTKNGYSKMADDLKEESTKKSVKNGHTHEPQPQSTTDRIITLVTTIVVAFLAITYIHYRDFS
nr:uncharacterized protein LOC129260970 [Lytechinus pictus]